jgi:hypothetical protein
MTLDEALAYLTQLQAQIAANDVTDKFVDAVKAIADAVKALQP